MEIITGVERRRRWSLAEKLRIVAEMEQPGGPGINELARRYDVSRGLLWNWRSQVRRGVFKPEPAPVFLHRADDGRAYKQPRREPCPVVLGDQDGSGSF